MHSHRYSLCLSLAFSKELRWTHPHANCLCAGPLCCTSTGMHVHVPKTGERPQRARQLWRWMYHGCSWVRSMDETAGRQDGISDAFRCACDAHARLEAFPSLFLPAFSSLNRPSLAAPATNTHILLAADL